MGEWQYLRLWQDPPRMSRKVFIGHQGQEAQTTLEETVRDLLKQGWVVDSRWWGTAEHVDWGKIDNVMLKRKKQDPE